MKAETVAACSFLLANWRKNATLTVADPANQVKIENLVDANHELTETVFTLHKDVFNYFEKHLSPALAVKAWLIAKGKLGCVDYVSLIITNPGLIRAIEFSPLSP